MIWFYIRGNSLSHNSLCAHCCFVMLCIRFLNWRRKKATATTKKEEKRVRERARFQLKTRWIFYIFPLWIENYWYCYSLVCVSRLIIIQQTNGDNTENTSRAHTHTYTLEYIYFRSWFACSFFALALAAVVVVFFLLVLQMFRGSAGIVWCVASDLWFPTIAWMICCNT